MNKGLAVHWLESSSSSSQVR